MRILLYSAVYPPSIGGIETVSATIAKAFSDLGHEVSVYTRTPAGKSGNSDGMKVVRGDSWLELLQGYQWCDVVVQNNVSARESALFALGNKPWLLVTATWIRSATGKRRLRDLTKLLLARRASNVAVSRAMCAGAPRSAVVVPNPFDGNRKPNANRPRVYDFGFVGRLVSDKGVLQLIDAFAIFAREDPGARLRVVGDGPDRSLLEARTQRHGLESRISFAGAVPSGDVAAELAQVSTLVVPSLWDEPFGVVALEGMAANCLVVASNSGGLPEAVGPAGLLYERGSQDALVTAMRISTIPQVRETILNNVEAHLERHLPIKIAADYLEILSLNKRWQL